MTNEAFARVKIEEPLRDTAWKLTDGRSVRFEYPLDDGGKADYALFDRQGRALAAQVRAAHQKRLWPAPRRSPAAPPQDWRSVSGCATSSDETIGKVYRRGLSTTIAIGALRVR